jgi:hypothetical protein
MDARATEQWIEIRSPFGQSEGVAATVAVRPVRLFEPAELIADRTVRGGGLRRALARSLQLLQ